MRKPTHHTAGSWPPTATQWLLGAIALSLLAQWFFRSHFNQGALIHTLGALSIKGLLAGRYWQPVSYLFLGDGPFINFATLLALYLAGSNLEFIIGRRHLWQLYFLAGILGGLGQLAFNLASQHPRETLLGASSAVVAVFVALTCVMPDLELAPLLGFPLPYWLKIKHCSLAAVLACAAVPILNQDGAFASQQAVRCLVGCLIGCVYMRQLGFGRRVRVRQQSSECEPMLQIPVFSQAAESLSSQDADAAAPRFTERERRMTPRQYISEQIDPILDKISLHGIGCLTREERRILEKGRDKISQREC